MRYSDEAGEIIMTFRPVVCALALSILALTAALPAAGLRPATLVLLDPPVLPLALISLEAEVTARIGWNLSGFGAPGPAERPR